VKAVFFDVDDTLVDYDGAARAVFGDVLGSGADYDDFRAGEHYERYLAGELGFVEMRERRMADYLVTIGHDGDPVDLERRRFEGMYRFYRLFDDALPCLDQLRARGLRLGLITNNDSAHQRAKLATVALDELFDTVVISGEIGVAKPDPRIFLHACQEIGVAPADALHVGDNRVADAEGATGAGLRGVWLDRRHEHAGEPVDYDVVTTLAGVPGLLG
jgi:putative hydrolase of the HAD superfamily